MSFLCGNYYKIILLKICLLFYALNTKSDAHNNNFLKYLLYVERYYNLNTMCIL